MGLETDFAAKGFVTDLYAGITFLEIFLAGTFFTGAVFCLEGFLAVFALALGFDFATASFFFAFFMAIPFPLFLRSSHGDTGFFTLNFNLMRQPAGD